MRKYLEKNYLLTFFQVLLTLAIFVKVKNFAELVGFSGVVVALLELIIVLELIRMLIDFVFTDEHRIKIRFMVDSTIVFFVRDLMLIVNDSFDVTKIYVVLSVIFSLVLIRILTIKYSPSN